MLNRFSESMKKNNVGNIIYRNAFENGKITTVGTDNRYDVEIAGSGKSRKNVHVNDTNITYAVDDIVGIGYEDDNRDRPIIIGKLRAITIKEVSGSVNSLGS